MEINVNDAAGIVEVWLANSEKLDGGLRESLQPLYAEYKKRKYIAAIFESGGGDLYEDVLNLAMQNRQVKL